MEHIFQISSEEEILNKNLFNAFSERNFEQMKFEIGKGANINLRKTYEYKEITLLMLAIIKNDFDMVKFLLESGARINAKDSDGNSALAYAVERQNIEIVKLLLSKKADVKVYNNESLLTIAVLGQNIALVKLLLQNGVEVNSKEGMSPLVSAVNFGSADMVDLLLKHGADVNKRLNNGSSPLIEAIKFSVSKEICNKLLKNGADVNLKDDDGKTALMHCCENNLNIEKGHLLLEYGADLNIQDKNGRTALMLACKKDATAFVRLFIFNNANLKMKDNFNKDAYSFCGQKAFGILKTALKRQAKTQRQEERSL